MQLTVQELQLLLDVLDQHLEGMDEAKECMIEDTATLNDLDTFSKTLQDHDEDVRTVQSIRQKVIDDYTGDDSP